MTWRFVCGFVCLALLGAPGCSDDPARTAPGAALSGNVRLTAQRTDAGGAFLGESVELAADGVAVLLRGSDGSQRTSLTLAGRFTFRELPAGRYVASIGVESPTEVSAVEVELGASDVDLPEPLSLESTGGLATYPNPFEPIPGLAIEWTTTSDGPIEVQVLSLARTAVLTHAYDSIAGLQHLHWTGVDPQVHEVPDGLYWVVMRKDGVVERSLVRKGPA